MIEVKNLVKQYGANRAVDDLSFHVERGQIYGFLGPNGAGKSTTMNILTGYIAPTSGEVKINGHDILEDAQEARKCIGYLPEIPPLYPEMTVFEYMTFAAELKKLPKNKKEDLIDEAMELTGITTVQNRLIKNLSKGYRQRVGLAQAILGFPEVIILDEPMVGLDPKQIIEVRELIKKLSENHTVILSSHILSEISAICDHIMIISKGKLVASDTPENLISLMKGSATLELTVCGSKSAVQKLTERFPEISDLQITDSTEEGAFDLTIRTESGVDLREKLFYYLAEQKMTLLRMQHSHVSLEDVFLELTENGADPEQAGEEEHASKKFGRGSDAEHAPEDSEKKTAGRFSMKHFRNKSAKTTEQETGKEDM